jgi:uncharacterized membrane protein
VSLAVSNVAVTDPSYRRVVLGHITLSFIYNTAIFVVIVNLVVG